MKEKEYLNESKYQKSKKMLILVASLILLIGLSIGLLLIFLGISKINEINKNEPKEEIVQKELISEEEKLKARKKELENQGIKYNTFAEYTDGDIYDLMIITNALDPTFSNCSSSEGKNNTLTRKYCTLRNTLEDIQDGNIKFEQSMKKGSSIPFFMFGAFIIISTLMTSGFVFILAKRREINAFAIQQNMPLAEESIEKMTPTVATSLGTVAREIKKGINEADSEENNK